MKDYALNEGILSNTLFSCTYMKAGQHHLFDELEGGILAENEGLEDQFERSIKMSSSVGRKHNLKFK